MLPCISLLICAQILLALKAVPNAESQVGPCFESVV